MEETIGYEALFSPEEWDDISFGQWSEPDHDPEPGSGELSPQGERVQEAHPVAVYGPPGQIAGNEDRFELECELCGYIGAADTEHDAQALAYLHEALGAREVAQ